MTRLNKIIEKTSFILVAVSFITGLLDISIYASQPKYREFVPLKENGGYHLSIDNERISVQKDYGFQYSHIVDFNGDLAPDYTRCGIAASVRLAGEMKRKPTREEVEIFNSVIKNSRRFGK